MKLVLFADLHLDAAFAWMGAGSGAPRRRREALRETLRRILELAIEVRADAVLCGGDLYEQERYTPSTAEFLCASFEEIHPLPVFLAPGNHDFFGARSLYRQVDWSPNVHVFTEAALAPLELADGVWLWGAAHRAPSGTAGFLDGFSVDRGGVHLALFHGAETGSAPAGAEGTERHAPFRAEAIAGTGLRHAFLGHYHRPQRGEWHTYPGNPEPLAFGEEGERGAVIATLAEDGSLEREWVTVAGTQIIDVSVDVSGCLSVGAVRERIREAVGGQRGVARVTISGEPAAGLDLVVEDLGAIGTGLDGLTLRVGDLRPPYDLAAIRREPTVRGEFVRDVERSVLPEDERRCVILTGLRALEGRDDLEVS
jgi:DNA repair exonuclease SbcCD nuclease subunit